MRGSSVPATGTPKKTMADSTSAIGANAFSTAWSKPEAVSVVCAAESVTSEDGGKARASADSGFIVTWRGSSFTSGWSVRFRHRQRTLASRLCPGLTQAVHMSLR